MAIISSEFEALEHAYHNTADLDLFPWVGGRIRQRIAVGTAFAPFASEPLVDVPFSIPTLRCMWSTANILACTRTLLPSSGCSPHLAISLFVGHRHGRARVWCGKSRAHEPADHSD